MSWKKQLFMAFAVIGLLAFSGTVIAETHTTFVTGFPLSQPTKDSEPFIVTNYCNFGLLTYVPGGGVTNLATTDAGVGDTVQLIKIPAATYVKSVGVRVVTAWTGAGTGVTGIAGIGDGSDVDGWIPNFSIGASASGTSNSVLPNQSGATVFTTGTLGFPHASAYGAPGKYYSAEDTIDLTVTTAGSRSKGTNWADGGLTNFVIQVWAECYKMPAAKRHK